MKVKDITIREARPDDAAGFLEYLRQVGAETDNLTFGEEGLPFTVESEREFLQSVQEDSRSVIYVALENDEIIGDASLSGYPRRMSHRGDFAISVIKSRWGLGIGSALMEKIIDYAKKHQIELIDLQVRNDNTGAIHLYEKYGFQTIGISPAFFKIGEEYIDFRLMYLDIRCLDDIK